MKLLSITNIEKFGRQGDGKIIILSRDFGKSRREIYWNFPDHITHSTYIAEPIENSNNSVIRNEGITIKYNEDD